jgi:hypothetical protein
MRHGLWAVVLGVCCWAAPGRADEQYPRVALAVARGEGTERCVDADELDRAVTARLQRAAFTKAPPVELRLELTLEKRKSRGFVAVVLLADAKGRELGRRELETRATNCSSLDDSLALVVALLVDSPEAQQEAQAQRILATKSVEVTPAPTPALTAPPKPRPLAIPDDTPPRRESYRLDIAGSFRGVVGEVPGVALGGELFVALRPPRFIELRVRGALFPADQTVGSQRGGRFSLAEFALELCPLEHELGDLRFSGCVGQSVGRVRSEGFGFARNARSDAVVIALGAGVSAHYPVAAPIFVLAGLGISAPIEQNTYVSRASDGSTQRVFRASVVTGSAFGGLGVEL